MIENTTNFYEKLEKRDEWFGEMLSIFSLFSVENISYPPPIEFYSMETQKVI